MIYTAGELAKKLGVSARTVRFYDEKKLLAPQSYSEAGYRLYNDESAERLQKILMLRFMDFTIEQISEIMYEEPFDLKKSLEEQEHLLLKKKEHVERILTAVRKTLELLEDRQRLESQHTPDSGFSALQAEQNTSGQLFWDNMRRTIEISQQWESVVTQYRSADNLNQRIALHDYSTAPVGFYQWMLGKINLAPKMKILDLGCGTAAFWLSNAEMLPEDLEIHLVDYSAGMLASAEKNANEIQKQFPEKRLRFVFDRRDATDFSYPVSGFDRIIANHVLFHLSLEARMRLYPKLDALLKENGRFSCSLIGKSHLFELHELVRNYYPEIVIPSASFDIWLESAAQELDGFFSVLETEEQKNDLLVPDPEPVFRYVSSYSSQASETLAADRDEFFRHVREKMNEDGLYFIHKSTGIVLCEKK